MFLAKFKRIGKLLLQSDYRHRYVSMRKLASFPRYVHGTTHLLGPAFEFIDAPSFLAMYREIVEREIYRFPSPTSVPFIIDGGANVGLSIFYFKKLYPDSQIVGFEPDPDVFSTLKKNVGSCGLSNIRLINKALWSSETTLEFMVEGADAGRIVDKADNTSIRQVETVRLRNYLNQPIQLLKLDIEGAETEVLLDCQDALDTVQNIFVEWHSFVNQPQTLHIILGIMDKAKFRVHIHPSVISHRPFEEKNTYHGMDMQLNIFGFRQ